MSRDEGDELLGTSEEADIFAILTDPTADLARRLMAVDVVTFVVNDLDARLDRMIEELHR